MESRRIIEIIKGQLKFGQFGVCLKAEDGNPCCDLVPVKNSHFVKPIKAFNFPWQIINAILLNKIL